MKYALDLLEIYGITYVPYIYIYTYRESSSQLASVGLAHARPNYGNSIGEIGGDTVVYKAR